MTERYAVIGHPVAHSRSPWIHARFARDCGHDIAYSRIEAPLDGFARCVDEFRAAGGKGLNVTVPFKVQACAYAAELSPRAREAQSVNTLSFGAAVAGDTTDGVGLLRDLAEHVRFEVSGRSVLLMGAGGAAQAVAPALVAAGISLLVVANRTIERAYALAARHPGSRASTYQALDGQHFDLIVNATSGGLSGDEPKLPEGVLRKGVLAYEMVYGRDTPFLAAARRAGADTSDGLGMLVEQAAESYRIWRGLRPETRSVVADLRKELRKA